MAFEARVGVVFFYLWCLCRFMAFVVYVAFVAFVAFVPIEGMLICSLFVDVRTSTFGFLPDFTLEQHDC